MGFPTVTYEYSVKPLTRRTCINFFAGVQLRGCAGSSGPSQSTISASRALRASVLFSRPSPGSTSASMLLTGPRLSFGSLDSRMLRVRVFAADRLPGEHEKAESCGLDVFVQADVRLNYLLTFAKDKIFRENLTWSYISWMIHGCTVHVIDLHAWPYPMKARSPPFAFDSLGRSGLSPPPTCPVVAGGSGAGETILRASTTYYRKFHVSE